MRFISAEEKMQLQLLDKSPRRTPRKLMHVVDYGSGMAHFKCNHCGHDDGWTLAETLDADKRGRPCPRCNPALSRKGE